MAAEKNLQILLKTMKPRLHPGEYVFCSVKEAGPWKAEEIILSFREEEGQTLVLEKNLADRYKLAYSFVASWITLDVHSALDAVGLTAAFSGALAAEGLSCNVVAGFYHDHIFVDSRDAAKAMDLLEKLAK